jgi:hypothetical protein
MTQTVFTLLICAFATMGIKPNNATIFTLKAKTFRKRFKVSSSDKFYFRCGLDRL